MAIAKRQSEALAKQAFEYAPAPESTDFVKIEPRYNLFIGGKFVEPHSKRWFETINPATEETLSEMAEADAEDVEQVPRVAREQRETAVVVVPPVALLSDLRLEPHAAAANVPTSSTASRRSQCRRITHTP